MIISRDVQFVENETWDGTVDIYVKIVSNVNNDDMKEEVVQTPHVIQPVAAPSTPMTPRHGSTQGPLTQVAAQATPMSTPRGQQTPSSISSRSTPTEPVKTRSLREIYEAGTPNSFSLFALFSPIYDPLAFEEAIGEEVWAEAMDEEIECIEKNQIWELVDVPKYKDVISVKWIYKTKQDADGNVQKHKARMVAKGFT